MSRYSDQTTTRIAGVDVPLGGVQIYVYNSSDGSLATLTDAGGVPIANGNPILSDDQGNFAFYATDALYDLAFYYGGKFIYRENGVPVGLANNIVAQSVAAAVAAAQAVIASHVFTVSSASGQSVTSRALLAGISSPVNGQIATLAENGNDYVFEFSTANLSLQVAGDYLGNYVAPTGQTGSAGAWVKQASQDASAQQSLTSLARRIEAVEDATKSALPALTTGGASYHAIYSTTRLVPTYSGAAFRGIRASDSAAIDIPFTGKTVNPGDIKALNGAGVAVRVDKWYDQSGNARDITQATAAARPCVRDDAYLLGSPLMLIDGGDNFPGAAARGFDFTHSLAGQNCTWFIVTDFRGSSQSEMMFSYIGSSGASGGRLVYQDYSNTAGNASSSILYNDPFSPSAFKNKHFRACPTVYAIRERAGPVDLFVDGASTSSVSTIDFLSAGVSTSETLSTGHIGYTTNGGLTRLNSNMRILAFVAVAGNLNDADVQAVTRALQTNFGVPSRYDSRIVIIGDSIGEGDGAANTLETLWYLRQQAIKGLPGYFNFSIAGNTLTNSYANRAFYETTIYQAGVPMVFVLQAGTNDIHALGLSASALYTVTTNYVSYLHGLGSNVKVVVNTILKRTDNTGAQETVRVAYNALVRANAAGADAINDVASEPVLAATGAESNTALLIDGIHPTSLECANLAPFYANAINTVLP